VCIIIYLAKSAAIRQCGYKQYADAGPLFLVQNFSAKKLSQHESFAFTSVVLIFLVPPIGLAVAWLSYFHHLSCRKCLSFTRRHFTGTAEVRYSLQATPPPPHHHHHHRHKIINEGCKIDCFLMSYKFPATFHCY
jgi:hypothetical protein